MIQGVAVDSPHPEPRRVVQKYSPAMLDASAGMSAADKLRWLESIRKLYWDVEFRRRGRATDGVSSEEQP